MYSFCFLFSLGVLGIIRNALLNYRLITCIFIVIFLLIVFRYSACCNIFCSSLCASARTSRNIIFINIAAFGTFPFKVAFIGLLIGISFRRTVKHIFPRGHIFTLIVVLLLLHLGFVHYNFAVFKSVFSQFRLNLIFNRFRRCLAFVFIVVLFNKSFDNNFLLAVS